MKTVQQTKTFWANVLMALIALLSAPDVLALIPPDGMKYVPGFMAAVNILLRRITSEPVTFLKQDESKIDPTQYLS